MKAHSMFFLFVQSNQPYLFSV